MENKNVTRTDLLNFLIKTYELKQYLEIGVQNSKQNFDLIDCESKCSVDPDYKANAIVKKTSDEFFEIWQSIQGEEIRWPRIDGDSYLFKKHFDCIFIDGLHTAEQVKKDFENSLRFLSPNGFIVLHDCNPEKEEHTIVPRPKPTGHWNGDVYKFAWRLFKDKNFITVDIDCGCGVYSGNKKPNIVLSDKPIEWVDFDTHRKELLNLISWDEFVKIHKND